MFRSITPEVIESALWAVHRSVRRKRSGSNDWSLAHQCSPDSSEQVGSDTALRHNGLVLGLAAPSYLLRVRLWSASQTPGKRWLAARYGQPGQGSRLRDRNRTLQ